MPVFLLVAFTVYFARKSLPCAIEMVIGFSKLQESIYRNFEHLRTVKNSTIPTSRPHQKNYIWRVTVQSVLFLYARDR